MDSPPPLASAVAAFIITLFLIFAASLVKKLRGSETDEEENATGGGAEAENEVSNVADQFLGPTEEEGEQEDNGGEPTQVTSTGTVSGDEVTEAVQVKRIIRDVKDGNRAWWKEGVLTVLIENGITEVAPSILSTTAGLFGEGKRPTHTVVEALIRYFDSIPSDEASSFIYPILATVEHHRSHYVLLKRVIRENELVNYSLSVELLKSDILEIQKRGLEIVQYQKAEYAEEDLEPLREAISEIETGFPDRAENYTREGWFLGGDFWECEVCGYRSNKAGSDLCSSCNRDRRGFKEHETKPEEVVEELRLRVESLEELLE